jgi:hypothetical protein
MTLDDFFDSKPVVQEQQKTVTEFKPNPKKGQNGVFKAIIRFIPNPSDPANKSILSKYIVYLENPRTKQAQTIDCPSTIGAQDPLQNTFFALRNSANPVLQENAKKFSRKQQYVSIVQVLQCESDPTLVGKMLPWRYGIKIHEKLMAELNPPMGEGRNPFNLFTGRPFSVQVKEVSGFPNYDSCQFFDLALAQSGMRIVVPDAQGVPTTSVVTDQTIASQQGKELVFNYLKENAPDMSRYEYHEWTAEQANFVNECIQIYSNPQATIQAMSAAQNPGMPQIQQPAMSAQAAMQPNVQPFSTPAAASAPTMPFEMPTMSAPTVPTMSAPTAPQLNADVDALLGGGQEKKTSAPTIGLDLADVLNGQML